MTTTPTATAVEVAGNDGNAVKTVVSGAGSLPLHVQRMSPATNAALLLQLHLVFMYDFRHRLQLTVLVASSLHQ